MQEKQEKQREGAATDVSPALRMGQRLREARLRRAMTQSEVAGDYFSVSYISAVERGQIRPSLGALERLSQRLEVPLADLVRDSPLSDSTVAGGREAAAERRQEEAESKLRMAQVQIHGRRFHDALETLSQIAPSHLSTHNALDVRRLLAHCYIELGQPEDARREALEGITSSERAGEEEMRARLRVELGAAYQLASKTQLALEQYRLAYEAAQQQIVRDPMFKLNVLYDLGSAYWLIGQLDDAIGYLREAVELARDVNNPEAMGDILWQLSVNYGAQGDTARAKIYALRSLAAYEQADNQKLTSRAYTRLGRATAQANQIEEALDFLNRAQAMTLDQEDKRGQAEVQRTLAAVYVSQQRVAEAHTAAQQAIDLALAVEDLILHAEALLAMAQVLEAEGKHSQADAKYTEAIKLLQESEARPHLADAYAAYSSFLESRGESKRALDVLKQAWQIRQAATV